MLGFKRPPTPMHRLDQDTSGCLLFARSPRARAEAQAAFEGGKVEKVYLAVLGAEIEGDEGLIEFDPGWCHQDMEIEFVGVFDTVGSLGVPGRLFQEKYRFHSVNLGDTVRNARQALAIDERRLRRVAAAAEILAATYAPDGEDIRVDVLLIAPRCVPRHIENAWIGY